MNAYPYLEYALDQGMELQVTRGVRDDFLARVWMGTPQSAYNAGGPSVASAFEALEHLLSKTGLKP